MSGVFDVSLRDGEPAKTAKSGGSASKETAFALLLVCSGRGNRGEAHGDRR